MNSCGWIVKIVVGILVVVCIGGWCGIIHKSVHKYHSCHIFIVVQCLIPSNTNV